MSILYRYIEVILSFPTGLGATGVTDGSILLITISPATRHILGTRYTSVDGRTETFKEANPLVHGHTDQDYWDCCHGIVGVGIII